MKGLILKDLYTKRIWEAIFLSVCVYGTLGCIYENARIYHHLCGYDGEHAGGQHYVCG